MMIYPSKDKVLLDDVKLYTIKELGLYLIESNKLNKRYYSSKYIH
jgi:hypothetical protein